MQTKNEILPAVAAIVFNNKGEVLLQRRRDTHKWCIISGHVEFGESVEHAMLREIHEEINVGAEIVRLIGVYSAAQYQTYHYADRTVHYIITCFEVRLTGNLDVNFTNGETQELKYFSPDAMPADMDQINPNWLMDALTDTTRSFIR
jgi:8-oxo-dGTP pyrophosphatase MutT (NUDIX family)